MVRRHISKAARKFWASVALLSVEMAAISVIFLASVGAFVFVARRVFVVGNQSFDQKIFTALEPYVNATNNKIMLFITFLGKHQFLIPANLLLIFYFLVIRRHRWFSIKVPAIAISSLAMMFLLKNLFGRARPLVPLLEEAKGLSFPSGHALMSVTFYGLLIYIVWHTIKDARLKWALIVSLLILIHLIGFSRVYLRVHYPTDVIAGFAMGFLWLVISLKTIRQIEKYTKRKIAPTVENPQVQPAPQS
jgi:membrane-associated phospholipid phosphatase